VVYYLRSNVVTLFRGSGNFADLIRIINSNVCVLIIIIIRCFLTKIFISKVENVFLRHSRPIQGGSKKSKLLILAVNEINASQIVSQNLSQN